MNARGRTAWRRALSLCLTLSLLGTLLVSAGAAGGEGVTRNVTLTMDTIKNCEVYYSEGGALVPVTEGEVIRKQTTGPYGILFFAAPKEGYALSAMGAKDTLGNYFTISDGEDDGTGSEFLRSYSNYKNLVEKGGYTLEQLQGILREAIEKGCDGALFFSRGAQEGGVNSTLTFYAERLPTLEKRIAWVQERDSGGRVPYQAGMSVGEGDVIGYELAVTFYPLNRPDFPVTYSNVTLLDEKTGNGADNPISVQPPADISRITQPETVTETVSYRVTQPDVLRRTVVNEAQLRYQYQSLHSAGALTAASSAAAAIDVHTSVAYQYVSGTEGMALPEALVQLAPEDTSYYGAGDEVRALSHSVRSFQDRENGGLWTLAEEGLWRTDDGQETLPGAVFPMPDHPVTLTARWTFAPRPSVAVRKEGEVRSYTIDDGGQVDYVAGYTITVENMGGETLNAVRLRDETLPEEGTDLLCRLNGVPVDLSGAVYDREHHTLTVPLPEGLPVGAVLTLSYESRGTGRLDEGGALTVQTEAEVQAEGAVSGQETQGAACLDQPLEMYDRIIIRPADIVIYAGGTPTDNTVVDGAAGSIAAQTNLPEPGFFMELPQALAEKLRAAADPEGTGELDLSDYLTLVDGWDRVWGLALYDEDGYSAAFGKNLYRLFPITPGQDPLRMQFYDGERYIVSSEFNISEALHKEYEMSIYPGRVEAGSVEAVLTVDGQRLGGYQLGFQPGTLTVRGTTGDRATTEILDLHQALPERVEEVTARAAEDTRYYINESQLLVEDPEQVELLVDNIVDTAHSESLKQLGAVVLDRLPNQSRLRYQFQYLDLVDTSMGNTWVTADQPVEVYWPYPEGRGPEDGFTIVHYAGLDREYDGSNMEGLVLGRDYTLEVYTTGEVPEEVPAFVDYFPLTAAQEGLFFTADCFSPYVLVWEEPAGESTGSSGRLPGGLNTGDHTAYLIGRGGGGIQPLETLTRGETAAIFFRLLTQEARADNWSTETLYSDVPEGSWHHNPVATLTRMGILTGCPDGTFAPDRPISRAEFVSVAVRFFEPPEGCAPVSFPDVSEEDWFAPAVAAGTALGLVEGRADGTFAPEASITRAEAAAILNRVLDRRPGGALTDPGWVDNPAGAWYYADMLEASVSHQYRWTGAGEGRREVWTAPLETPDWAALERCGPQP